MKLFKVITKSQVINSYAATMSEQYYFVSNNLKELLQNIKIDNDDISEIIQLSDYIEIIEEKK